MTQDYVSVLIQKIQSKQASIGIVGLGYVGLPLVLCYIDAGFKVVGIDADKDKIEQLQAGISYIKHIDSNKIETALSQGLEVTDDFSVAQEMDALIICVPTPVTEHREPDISYIIDATERLLPYLAQGQILSLESTTYPGTTEEELLPRIERQGFKVGHDYFLVFSPEREDPGNPEYTTKTIPKVCGGHSNACLEVGVALYSVAIDTITPVSSTKVAEMTKLLENTQRAVNIGLMNEMKIIADKMGIDIFEVINAAKTKPFGFTPYYPGPGLGGHCIPVDPFHLAWKSREYGMTARFVELAGEINSAMPGWVVSKLMDALNDQGKALKGAKLLVLGIAYKKNIDDVRESPSITIMELLQEKGAVVSYSDPFVPEYTDEQGKESRSTDITQENLQGIDAVVIATDHDGFDYGVIEKQVSLIIDTRGIYKRSQAGEIIRA